MSDAAKQDYAFEPNWQHGFVIVNYFTVAGKLRYSALPVPIVDGRFSYGGKLYDGHKCQ